MESVRFLLREKKITGMANPYSINKQISWKQSVQIVVS
jgi:hypothetical protein